MESDFSHHQQNRLEAQIQRPPGGQRGVTGGWCYFSNPGWTNYPARFYRLRSP
jgi:hypothetical protein